MKKVLSIFVAMAFAFTLMLPVGSFAQTQSAASKQEQTEKKTTEKKKTKKKAKKTAKKAPGKKASKSKKAATGTAEEQ